MTVPDAKKHPRLRRFVLRSVRVPVGPAALPLVVPDANAWVRAGAWVAASERGREPPYWVRIWPAAEALAHTLARFGPMGGVRVLDLGCGLGLPGITAARAGAQVTFVDCVEDALAFAVWNAERVRAPGGSVAALSCDWARETVPGEFDVVLLSDVTYRGEHHGPLRRQLRACLAPQGVVLHADPGRAESRTFIARLRETYTIESLLRRLGGSGASPAGPGAEQPVMHVCAAARAEQDLRGWRDVFAAIRSRDAARGRTVGAEVSVAHQESRR